MCSCLVLVPPVAGLARGQTTSREIAAGENLTLAIRIIISNYLLSSVSWTYALNFNRSKDTATITTSAMLPATHGPVVSSLQIIEVVPGDTGNYFATASNDAGNSTVQFRVNVTKS